ncbi:hypothetical protein TNCV_4296231 [Trichonephila clavipes]|nr:hypothetical protein TNCV_4296231 [Trichonephila clavipes]
MPGLRMGSWLIVEAARRAAASLEPADSHLIVLVHNTEISALSADDKNYVLNGTMYASSRGRRESDDSIAGEWKGVLCKRGISPCLSYHGKDERSSFVAAASACRKAPDEGGLHDRDVYTSVRMAGHFLAGEIWSMKFITSPFLHSESNFKFF